MRQRFSTQVTEVAPAHHASHMVVVVHLERLRAALGARAQTMQPIRHRLPHLPVPHHLYNIQLSEQLVLLLPVRIIE